MVSKGRLEPSTGELEAMTRPGEYDRTMINSLLRAYDFNLAYARELVEDVDDDLMAQPGGPGLENHPAWTLGHICSGAQLTIVNLGGEHQLPQGWEELFKRRGPGDPRFPEQSIAYPSKQQLLEQLESLHKKVSALILNLDQERWAEEQTWRFSQHFPTMYDLTHFMCVTHEMMHLNQLAAWRRAMNLPSALGRM